MKKLSNKNSKEIDSKDRDRLLALYDAAPYPEVLADSMTQGTPLVEHWINAAVAPDGPSLHPAGNLLIAGCGSGAEALVLARKFPQATIVGVDFSDSSIARAKAYAAKENLTNITFEVADLMSTNWFKKYEVFDFISCHGVADFVLDVSALMQTLATCLAPHGVICMTVNSPYHPGGRLREAFATLGVSPESFSDSSDQRALLQLMVGLMGDNVGIEGLANAPKAYLEVDVFPPIAHHDSVDTWCERAEESGLYFCGSMAGFIGLTQLSDKQLPLLYRLGRPAMSAWMARLRQRPGMQLLFSRRALKEPSFDKPDTIWSWRPQLASCLGTLPAMAEEPDQARPITLQFPGLPPFVIHSTAYDLEVLRGCDGSRSIGEIRDAIPVEGDEDSLLACLFRAYQFGVLAG
jgi:SAM-dependent methyltransferase